MTVRIANSLLAVMLLASAGSSKALEGEITFTGVPNIEAVAALDPSGTTASIKFTVDKIPLSASEHSPPCATHRASIERIPISGNQDSECVRVCVEPPEGGYEFNPSIPVDGRTSHGFSQIFNTQAFENGRMCVFGKNWSAHEAADFDVRFAICKAGSGCFKLPPGAQAAPAAMVAPVRREPKPMLTPRNFRRGGADYS